LPTEGEWEYAARAGSTEARYASLDEIAWYAHNSGKQKLDSTNIDRKHYAQMLTDNGNAIHGVGQKRANAWGLFDILGNVWEWVSDWYDSKYYRKGPAVDPEGPSKGKYRVLRGGSCVEPPRSVRVSRRNWYGPETRNDYWGFRCVREAKGP